ncbi:MAG: transcriptional regulator, partial [Verrucomicrobia bacterium]
MQPTILIVDDEKHTRDGLRRLLENEYDVYVAADIAGAIDVLEREQIDLLLTDLRLGNEDGMTLIDRALKMPHPPICIMMTAYGSVDIAVEAMKRGAYDFVTKPLNLDKVEMLIARALQSRKLEQENRTLRQQVDERYGLENIIGESAVLREVLDTIRQVAPSSANVLLGGESGTGKELAAHAIHNLSRRNKAKFVIVHCAALSPTLLESELFGHEKGAFTGAHERRIGRFEQANGGTIFLDEVAEISPSTQVKLLRVISEERAFERVGGNQTLRADVRLIAATNKNLETLVREGKFRDDLFFRLNVVRITMPPLRERKEDVPLLVRRFLRHFCKANNKPLVDLTADAMDALLTYNWPGNVRELRTAIEHGVVMATGPKITVRDLPTAVRQAAGASLPRGISAAKAFGEKASPLDLHETEKKLIMQA